MSKFLIDRSDDYEERLTKTQKAACYLARKGFKVSLTGIMALTGGDIRTVKERCLRLVELKFLEDLNAGTKGQPYSHLKMEVLKDENGKPFDVTSRKPAKFDPANGKVKRGSMNFSGF